MHPAALSATSYVLLLSSLVTLVILLRRRYKSKKKLPFYTLSTSDVFSALLTAVILLVNDIEAVIRLSYNSQSDTSDTPNRAWIIEDKHKLPFPPIHNLRDAADQVDLNVTLTCDAKDIFMQYGILLAGLTNAFVSLLTFAVQCNLSAASMKQKCASIMESSGNTALEAKDARRGRGISENEQESTSFQSRGFKSSFIRRIMKISRSQRSQVRREDDGKSIGFLVTSHWLAPFLVVALLYFAEYGDTSILRHTDDIECVFESNFPMFYVFSDPENKSTIANSIVHTTPLGNGDFVKELLNISTPSITEVDQVVSKVQSIVRTALNHARNFTQTVNLLDNSGSYNMTEYIVANNIMNYIANNTNGNNVIRRPNSTLLERDMSTHDSLSNLFIDQNIKVSLRDLLKNASEEADIIALESRVPQVSAQDSDAEDALIYFKQENTTERTGGAPITRNGASISNNRIYHEIIKRIQAASAHAAKRNNSRGYITKRKPNSIQDLLVSEIDDFNTETQSGSFLMTNECLLSIKFLKLHLFVLCFAIYFLSILLSCILQMRGKYMYRNILAILRTRIDLSTPPLHSNIDSKEDSSEVPIDEPHSEFRLPTKSKGISHENSMEGSDSSQKPRNDRGSRTGTEETRKDQSYKETQNKSIFLEINCMLRILNIIRLSLILCVILWTPALLGTLLKLFSCTHAPQWLTDATFLSAISFGIVRNILNINIIKIQEVCSDASKKENRIHPIKLHINQ